MDQETYYLRRNQLVCEFKFLKDKHLPRSAAARVREIAKLDFEFSGVPVEKTKAWFNYKDLLK